MPIADNWLELIKRGILSVGCDYYLFSSANTDSLQLGSAFTGNLKVMINAPSETGLHPDIIAGRMGSFAADTWVQYEISASALTYIVDATFNGRVAYAKDGAWFNVDMGALEVVNLWTYGDMLNVNTLTAYSIIASSSHVAETSGNKFTLSVTNNCNNEINYRLDDSSANIAAGQSLTVELTPLNDTNKRNYFATRANVPVVGDIVDVSLTLNVANQEIPNSGGDIIENVEPSSWQKGECVPEWQRVHTEQFTEQYT